MPVGSVLAQGARRGSAVRGPRVRRAGLSALVLAGLVVGGLLGATAAQAHNVLRSTDPADGSTVPVAPDHVTLTFDEPALALGTEIEVRAPGGALVSDGDPALVDNTVTEKLAGDLPAGDYTVTWRVTSADGHPITGEFTFTATGATTIGAGAAGPSASPDASEGDDGSSSAPVIVLVVIAAAVISWLLWRRRRPRDSPADE